MLRRNELSNKMNQLVTEKDQMFMDISIFKGESGDELELFEEKKETAVLLLEGDVEFYVDNHMYHAKRKNVFEEDATAIHISCNTNLKIVFHTNSELLIQQTENQSAFPFVFYDQQSITKETFGDDPIKQTTQRIVSTVFDYNNAPYSHMVLGEIINYPGIWSSYPPHQHPQPEVYYYKFNRPEGFGTCFIGDDAYKVVDHSVALIPGGKTHPQNAAPGYAMYYTWMIPHVPSIWDKTRTMDENHTWLLNKEAKVIKL